MSAPTDTEILDWVERKGIAVRSFILLSHVNWEVNGYNWRTTDLEQLAVGDTLRETIIEAMRAHP